MFMSKSDFGNTDLLWNQIQIAFHYSILMDINHDENHTS